MIPLATLKAYCRIRTGHTAEDGLLEDVLEPAAVAAVQRYTNRYFGPEEEVTLVLHGPHDKVLILPDTPAVDPSSGLDLLLIEKRVGTGWETVEADDYERDGFFVHHDSAWPDGKRQLRATYTRGYAEGEEPDDVRMAVIQTVAEWYENRENTAIGTLVNELPLHVKDLLNPWRRIPL